jgi:predicted PhzF superfamily epimerase YddE/YHI9
MSGLPSVQEMQAMPSDKFAQLLEKVNYPDAFKNLVPDSVSMPSREALLGVDREEAVASLKMLKDNFLELLEATAAKGRYVQYRTHTDLYAIVIQFTVLF